MAPEYLPLVCQRAESRMERGLTHRSTCELELVTRDGRCIPMELSSSPILADGKMVAIQGIARDITERKRAEEAARQREADYRALAENLPQLVWITDTTGDTQYLNRSWSEYTGTSLEQARQWRWVEAVHPDDRPLTLEKWHAVLVTGALFETEFRLRRRDGQYRWHRVQGVPVRDEDGSILRWIGTCMDVEAQKQEFLAQAQLAAIVEVSEDPIISTALDGTIRTWNPGAERALGYAAEEMIGRSISVLTPPECHYPPMVLLEQVRAGETVHHISTTRLRKDGARRQFSLTLSPIRDAEGRVVGAAGISRDITERQRAEDALRESEERFRGFMDHCPAAAFIKDENGRLQYVNAAWRRQFDPEPAEWHGKTEFDFWPAETAALFQASDRQCLTHGQPLQIEECGHLPGSDETRHWLVLKFPMSAGNRRRIGGMAWDVTDRKQAEAALAEREERFRQLADAMPQIVWVTQPDGFHEYYNRQWYEYTGLTYEQTQGEGWNPVFHPDDQPLAWERWHHALATGEPYEIEYRCRRFDGEYRWFLGRALPQRDSDGRILRWFGTCTDIHDFKEAEAVLCDKEAKLADAVRIARMGYWSRDLVTGLIEWSEELYEIFGVTPSDDEQTFEWFLGLIHDEDRERVRATIEEAEAQAGSFDQTYRIPGPDGPRVIHEVGHVFTTADGKPCRIAGTGQDVTGRARSEEALHVRDRAIRAVTQGILITDPGQADNPIVYVSPGFERLTGYPSGEALGRNCRFLQGRDTDPEAAARIQAAIEAGEPCTVELLNYRKDGTPFWNALSLSPVRDEAGRLTHFVVVQADVTERRQLEEQLRQAQKMEGIGQLAGGIAHDFNNMLAVINGYSELVLASLPLGNPLRRYVEEVGKAGERAAGLTRQLLAFSRRQILEPKVLDLNQVVLGLDKMLRRLIGEDIELVTLGEAQPLYVKADPGQLEQLLVNLAVNARDAMPTGGTLTLTTRNVLIDATSLRALSPDAEPGHYARISVQDTGTGIGPEVLPHIFEPFFTTKGVGKGTGLGLSTVYGIVRQSGGFLQVETASGQGTTFAIYLPRVDAPAPAGGELLAPVLPSGTETILVAEDEPMVRALMVDMLRRSGYTVLEALQGDDALRLMEEYEGTVHLLLTDVVMPRMSGPALAEAVLARRPDTVVLFVSGYTDDAVLRHGVLTQEVEFLQKPFEMRDLAERVRRLLDQRRARAVRGTILVIDHVADQRESLAEVLREEGYVVLTAGGGAEALALLQQEPRPGLILFDLMMPGMNGWVFRQEQRRDPRLRDIPAVALSGQVDPGVAGEYLEVAATLQKPAEIAKVLEIARRFLPCDQNR